MISLTCSACSRRFGAPDGSDGKSAKCPNCGNRITIPLRVSREELSQGSADWRQIPIDQPQNPAIRSGVLPLVLKSMIFATILWPVSMVGCTAINYWSAISNAHSGSIMDSQRDTLGRPYFVDRNGEVQYTSQVRAGAAFGSVATAVVGCSFLYGMAMVVLIVFWFVSRQANPPATSSPS